MLKGLEINFLCFSLVQELAQTICKSMSAYEGDVLAAICLAPPVYQRREPEAATNRRYRRRQRLRRIGRGEKQFLVVDFAKRTKFRKQGSTTKELCEGMTKCSRGAPCRQEDGHIRNGKRIASHAFNNACRKGSRKTRTGRNREDVGQLPEAQGRLPAW